MDFLPRAYQRPIIDLFADKHRINVFASPGTGKTSATLAALDTMVVLGEDVLPALVTAPLRVANSVWDTEVGRWARFRGLRVAKIIGNADQRRAAMNQHADIYVTNYENLVWLRNELGTKWPFKTVVADESTRIKGHRTHIRPHPSDPTREVLYRGGSKGATALASRAPQTDFWINLTGTPAPNGLSDLWGQQWVLDFGKALGRTHTQFMERYYKLAHGSTRTMPKWEILDHSTDNILDAIKPNTVTIDAYDWFDIERPVNLDYPVRLTPKLAAQYSEMHSNSWLELEDGNTAEGVNIGSKIMKCRQISAGGLRTDNGDWQTLHTLKLDALEEIVEKLNGAPLLVAYHFKHDIKLIQSRFKHAMILPTGARQKKVEDDWNAGKIKMLLVHPQSAGHGLNMQYGGNNLCVFTPDWNAEYYAQVIERIGPTRQAQAGLKRLTYVHHIYVAGTWDELIIKRLQGKLDVEATVKAAMALTP